MTHATTARTRPSRRTPTLALTAALILPGLLLPACAGGRVAGAGDPRAGQPIDDHQAAFEPDAYPRLFDAARETLAEYRFTLDRVDAARGIITTAPKQTAGLATPWDREQSNLGDEVSDLIHQHQRTARIRFEPPEAPARVRVEVAVDRVRRPDWRVESDAIRLSSFAVNPQTRRTGQGAEFLDTVREDRALAARLLARIVEISGINTPPATAAD
jgi:hypothetical protein